MDEKKFAIKETVSAEEVKMLRKKLGLTQRDFAGLLGCSKPTVERLEREGTATKGPMALLMKLLDRDAEYIQTLMICLGITVMRYTLTALMVKIAQIHILWTHIQ